MTTANLFDQLIKNLSLKSDAALARRLGTSSSAISKMRNGFIPLSAVLMVRISEETGWPTKHIKALIAEGGQQWRER